MTFASAKAFFLDLSIIMKLISPNNSLSLFFTVSIVRLVINIILASRFFSLISPTGGLYLLLLTLCKIHFAKIINLVDGQAAVIYGGEKRFMKTYIKDLHEGDFVTTHLGYVAEKISREIYEKYARN